MGDKLSPRGGSLHPPRPEPRRRQKKQCLGRARERCRQAANESGDARRGGNWGFSTPRKRGFSTPR
jgi:hypothetical protein